MSTPQLTVVFNHLKKLKLKPVYLSEPASRIAFRLAGKISAEIFVQPETRQQLLLNISVSMDIKDIENAELFDLFTLALAPHLTPVTLTSTGKELLLQLDTVTSLKTLTDSIDAAIVLVRHSTGIAFQAALKLNEEPDSLIKSLDWAIQQLTLEWA
ncbi:hypothetical protein EOPP23_17540 [Endozoicomonas sp. OPT23]|uniref:hypothetical protein n=1 Tax=Endozoicomonas sp. OPT23 TaxID=2072845 RepID=UPI00129B46EE|nr:hypothetical protein [Endozoicomonas sp. OPT23]MRI34787.1 hypothetical protein [Endozoicomonas sp. OPT23]